MAPSDLKPVIIMNPFRERLHNERLVRGSEPVGWSLDLAGPGLPRGAILVAKVSRLYRLRHFKGPFVASLSRLWLTRCVAGGTMHLDFLDVNRKYGRFST